MKRLQWVCLIILSSFSCVANAQGSLNAAFARAVSLNDRQEYLNAAKAFREVQDMALQAGDWELYLSSVTAAGECYYMLNLTNPMKTELDKANTAYARYASHVSDSVRLCWEEAVCKLQGAYEYCMFDANLSSPYGSEDAYNRCLAILDTLKTTTLFDDEEAEILVHRELLSLYYRMKEYPDALNESYLVFEYYGNMGYREKPKTDADRRYNRSFVDAFRSHAIVLARLKRFDEAEEVLSMLPKSCSNLPSVLRTKGKIWMMHSDVDGKDRRGEAMGCYDQYIKILKQQLNEQMDNMTDAQREQYWLGMHDFLFDCYRLGDYSPEMLYDLALFSKGYLLDYQKNKVKSYTWKDVQKSLDANSCAVEFVQYNGKDDEKLLAAMVVTPTCEKPVFVPVIDLASFRKMRVGTLYFEDAMRSLAPEVKDILYTDSTLFGKIWTAELMAATSGASKIYFSADGILHQLAIEYMMPDPTRRCHRLTSTRVLIGGHKPMNTSKMLLFGGIDYGMRIHPSDEGNDEQAYSFFQPYARSIVDLPGTQVEVDSVAALRHSDNDLLLTGKEATDSAFRAAIPHYPIVLISTHGFFLGKVTDGTDMRPPVGDNSMSESGLAFAGCRYSLSDSTYEVIRPDGVLSAKELSKLTMDSTDLIVLSACQTGLGTITADGVYGVQRALKQAGVKAMIVSLWNVDDEATSILMRSFFGNLQEAGDDPDVYEAFMKARQQLMTEQSNSFNSSSLSSGKTAKHAAPRYSNAFILIDVQ